MKCLPLFIIQMEKFHVLEEKNIDPSGWVTILRRQFDGINYVETREMRRVNAQDVACARRAPNLFSNGAVPSWLDATGDTEEEPIWIDSDVEEPLIVDVDEANLAVVPTQAPEEPERPDASDLLLDLNLEVESPQSFELEVNAPPGFESEEEAPAEIPSTSSAPAPTLTHQQKKNRRRKERHRRAKKMRKANEAQGQSFITLDEVGEFPEEEASGNPDSAFICK